MGHPVQSGDVVAERYRVEDLLGEGGMGAVVAALDLTCNQRVALKFMLPKALSVPNAAERFIREARAQTRLRSEHVARVLDVGTMDHGLPFIVMEYLYGIDVSELLSRCLHMRQSEAAALLIQVCNAVAEAHEQGVIHRDLKPSNVFLTLEANGTSLVKVLDFGLSKILEEDGEARFHTTTTGVMGSPAYMSPEQAKSAKYADERSDIWSLGVLLYQLTTGKLPFPAESNAEVLAKVLYERPIPMRDRASWVTPGFESVVMRCLEKHPDQRYQSAAELADDLVSFAEESEPGTGQITVQTQYNEGERVSARILYEPEAVQRMFPHFVSAAVQRRGQPVDDDDRDHEVSAAITEPVLPNSAAKFASSFDNATTAKVDGYQARRRWPYVMALVLLSVVCVVCASYWYATPSYSAGDSAPEHPPASVRDEGTKSELEKPEWEESGKSLEEPRAAAVELTTPTTKSASQATKRRSRKARKRQERRRRSLKQAKRRLQARGESQESKKRSETKLEDAKPTESEPFPDIW